jgi:hypothetical protein
MAEEKDKIPLFKTWNQWYLFVTLFLVGLILFFQYFTNYFS